VIITNKLQHQRPKELGKRNDIEMKFQGGRVKQAISMENIIKIRVKYEFAP